MQGAAGIVYGKAAIQGVESSTTAVNVDLGNGQNVSTIHGYPVATEAALSLVVDGIGAAGSDEDFVEIRTGGTLADGTQWVSFGIENYTQQCVVYTMAANANTPATVTISTDAANVCGPDA